jgi:dTMP kinase
VPGRGAFITFEGPEGCGKTTHAGALAARLDAAGKAVVRVREPGGTATGEAIREILQHHGSGEPLHPETELFLFEACRAQLVRDVIHPALDAGKWVVCDRFADSTLAYQGAGRGLAFERLVALNDTATGGLSPDLTFLLDVDPAEGLRRAIARRTRTDGNRPDRFEDEAMDFHVRVREGFLSLARLHPERIVVLDTRRAADAVDEDVWRAVQPLMPASGHSREPAP